MKKLAITITLSIMVLIAASVYYGYHNDKIFSSSMNDEKRIDLLTSYVNTIQGMANWDHVPANADEVYISSKQGTFYTGEDRRSLFGWDPLDAQVLIVDQNGFPVTYQKHINSVVIVFPGKDGMLSTNDDIRIEVRRK